MIFKNTMKKYFQYCSLVCLLFSTSILSAQEIFIFRPDSAKNPVSLEKKVTLHGEYFGYLLYPGNFPSYNDLSGPEDRFNFGFQNIIYWGPDSRFMAQLLTHDDGSRRTKFDWHFSLRQKIMDHMVLILGHDSNHDSDAQSRLLDRTYFLNRNYVGFGLPFRSGSFFIEAFTWFFHHSNHRSHLDYSGEKLSQEYGIRLGYQPDPRFTISFQAIAQSDTIFAMGQSYLADLIIRIDLLRFLNLSIGARLWKDIGESRLTNKYQYFQLHWGIVIPF